MLKNSTCQRDFEPPSWLQGGTISANAEGTQSVPVWRARLRQIARSVERWLWTSEPIPGGFSAGTTPALGVLPGNGIQLCLLARVSQVRCTRETKEKQMRHRTRNALVALAMSGAAAGAGVGLGLSSAGAATATHHATTVGHVAARAGSQSSRSATTHVNLTSASTTSSTTKSSSTTKKSTPKMTGPCTHMSSSTSSSTSTGS